MALLLGSATNMHFVGQLTEHWQVKWGFLPKRISALLATLEERGHIETEIFRDEKTGQILRRNIYPIMKSSRGCLASSAGGYPIPKNGDTPIPENEDTSPRVRGYPIPENGEEKYKEEIKKENKIAHLKKLQNISRQSR